MAWMGRELTRGWVAVDATGGLACWGSHGCAGLSCLAPVAAAGSTYLAGSESLARLWALPVERPGQARAGLRGDAGPAIFEKDPGSVACPGFIPPTVVPEAVKVRRLRMSGPS